MSDPNGQQAAHGDRDLEVFEFGTAPVFSVDVEIPVNRGPIGGIDISPDGSQLMVTNYGADSLSVIDTDTGRVVETIAGVGEPFAIVMGGGASHRAYVSTVSTAYDSISVIDVATNTVVDSHPLALSVSDLAVSRDGKYLYASRNGARGTDVVVLDTATGRSEVIDIADTAGAAIECVQVSPDGDRIYLGANGPSGGQLVVVATRASSDREAGRAGRARWRRKASQRSEGPGVPRGLHIVGTIEVGAPIRDVAVSPDGGLAYVASCGPDFGPIVDIIDARTHEIVSTRKVGEIGGMLTRLTLSGDGDRAYLVSDDGITVLCTLTQDVIGFVKVGEPSCVIESPDGKYLYIADHSGRITMAPVASTMPSLDSGAAFTLDAGAVSAEWVMPELLQREPAMA